ncbi:hypothetical protein FEM48_Zijuj01G0087800 [Ziziphus jujuba var. spinosa]|uniref:Uncharacterized protein n=1 Tax=Ziziphus jujuba var. spinosa TaxID=714518 RepID=A0A978W0A0_ZIZJJ|nr:hypothetical protein FEM48_Zijuj01G0087800 [Ziziphus jujuba var. spinosa]
MPLEEFAAQPLVKEVEFLNHMYEVCKAKVDGGYSGFSQLPVSGFRDDVGESSFYFNAMDLKNAKDNAEDPKNAEKNVEDLNNAANANTKMRSRCCCDNAENNVKDLNNAANAKDTKMSLGAVVM